MRPTFVNHAYEKQSTNILSPGEHFIKGSDVEGEDEDQDDDNDDDDHEE